MSIMDTVQSGDLIVSQGTPIQEAFSTLMQGAAVASGSDLVKDKSALVGVPFLITSVTFRDGVKQDGGKRLTNYVSVECVVADAATIQERQKKGFLSAEIPFSPLESLVFNDGSTGIARQLTEYLHARGIIQVYSDSEEAGQWKTGGGMGESVFDRHRSSWATPFEDDAEFSHKQYPGVKLFCPRGLRVSEYIADATDDTAVTYYIG